MDPKEPDLNENECEGEGCPGWAVFNEREIERCDLCERFQSDEDAIAHVLALEDIDVTRQLEASAQRALVVIRDELAAVIEETSTNPAVDAKKLAAQLEILLGRSIWLERHRWHEHAAQFARLLSEMLATGEETEDAEAVPSRDPGYFIVKIRDLEKSMDCSWLEIKSIFHRADAAFEADKPRGEVP